jgi:hypothetical protein
LRPAALERIIALEIKLFGKRVASLFGRRLQRVKGALTTRGYNKTGRE